MANYPYFIGTGATGKCPYCGQRMPEGSPDESTGLLGTLSSIPNIAFGMDKGLNRVAATSAPRQAQATQHFLTAEERRRLTKSPGYNPCLEINSEVPENPVPKSDIGPKEHPKDFLITIIETRYNMSNFYGDTPVKKSKVVSLEMTRGPGPMSLAEFDAAVAKHAARAQAEYNSKIIRAQAMVDAENARRQADVDKFLARFK